MAGSMVVSPDHRASDIGAAVLADGGNALDAAVATNLALAVTMPFACGLGGDLLALVWDGTSLDGHHGTGRAPSAATPAAVRARADGEVMPHHGPLPVTVPGAVDGWFALLDRYGTRSFGDLAEPARELAIDGIELDELGRRSLTRSAEVFTDRSDWQSVYGEAGANGHLAQPGIARTLARLAEDGRDVFHGGEIAAAIADHVQTEGGLLAIEDLVGHAGQWVTPLQHTYRDRVVWELPPPTQGVSALQAFAVLDHLGPLPPAGPARTHLLLEAAKAALGDRRDHVGDPDTMQLAPSDLLAADHIRDLAARIDADTAAHPAPARPVPGGTVYLTTCDADGMVVSLSQSNFMGFGSGLTVPGWGINLHNRGAYFRLDGIGADQLAPGRQPLHTLIPAMVFDDDRPWLSFGTMGGDNQVGIQLQLLAALADDGTPLQAALDAPRWSLSAEDWTVDVEASMPPEIVAGLTERGHEVNQIPDRSIGWAQTIRLDGERPIGASDPRSNGAVREAPA